MNPRLGALSKAVLDFSNQVQGEPAPLGNAEEEGSAAQKTLYRFLKLSTM